MTSSIRCQGVRGLGILTLALAALAGCGTKLDMPKMQKAVSDGINAQLAMPIASVDCPQAPPMVKAGASFDCTATPVAGGRLTVNVTENDAAGNITWKVTKTEGLLDLQAIEKAVTDGLKAQSGVDATVSCGGRWRAAKAGDQFTCEAKTADGTTSEVAVTTKDESGNIDWKVGTPPAEEAEPATPHEG